MNHFSFWALLVGVAWTTQVSRAADNIFINNGDLSFAFGEAPQIDARAFYNSGTFSVYSAPLPYDFTSVQYYTNRGTMTGGVGFTFDHTTYDGQHLPSVNFVNQRGGLIQAVESFGFIASNTVYYPTFLTVLADNIVNEGSLSVENSGILRLEGRKINLTRGGLSVGSIQPDMGAGPIPGGYDFRPEPGIYDVWWGVGSGPTNNTGWPGQDSSSILFPLGGGAGYQARSPSHFVADNNGNGFVRVATTATFFTGMTNVVGGIPLTITNIDGTTTNLFAPTNIIRQAVFVGVSDTNNFSARARFFPSTVPDVAHDTVAIELRLSNTNVVAATGETNAIYIVDRLASETNLAFGTNIDITPVPTLRPFPYEVWRSQPFEFFYGNNGNAIVDPNFVYDRSFSNRFVTNFYAGYSAYVDYLTVRPPIVPGMGPLDQPGRIEIIGDDVDLTKARFRGMGVVAIDAKNLISTSNTVVDAPNLLYNLGSSSGLLTVQNLAQAGVVRMAGYIDMWSGLWTNQMATIYTNYFIDDTTNYYNPITNPVDVGIHVVIVSADLLDSTQRVIVHDFVARSRQIVVNDPITVTRKLILDGESFTLNGTLSLTNLDTTNGLPNLVSTNMPGVSYFTNNGVLTVPNLAYFGSDAGSSLRTFINTGTLNAFAASIEADAYANSGTMNIGNRLDVRMDSGRLEGGRDVIRGSLYLTAKDLKMRNHSIRADEGLFIEVTDSLSDDGVGSSNIINVADGFHLLTKPAKGDLLGTTFQTTAAKFSSTVHTWAAEDLGPVAEGFKDNAAIGRLVLDVYQGGELRFSGPLDWLGNPRPGNYALYVDYLQLQNAVQSDPEAVVYIYPGLTIYFGNSNVSPEELDGKFDGRLRWVKSYVGPTSGTPVASRQGGYQVKTIYVNAALLESPTIDSDGDGTVNAYDTWPFDGVTLKNVQVTGQPATHVRISWDAAAETVYRVEKTSGLTPPEWTPHVTVTNTEPSVQTLTITDAIPSGKDQKRFYRVRYDL